MHRSILVLLTLFATLTGCTYQRSLVPSDTQRLSKFNMQVADRSAHLLLADSTDVLVRGLQVAPDSTTWIDRNTDAVHSIATDSVLEVRVTRRDLGARDGTAIGAVSGFATGMLIGLISGDDDAEDWIAFTAEEKGLMLGVPGAAVVGLIGLIAGASTGSKVRYSVAPDPRATLPSAACCSRDRTLPPPSEAGPPLTR